MNKRTKFAIFASYNASNLDPVYEAMNNNSLNIDIKILITNNTNANALNKAKKYDIDSKVINEKTTSNVDDEIYNTLKQYDCQYVILMGYMKKLSSFITNNFIIINSHPSLLPLYGGAGMYGRFVHEAVLKNNEKKSGISVHYVNEHYDEGELILQESLDVFSDDTVDTLEQKVKLLESNIIVKAIQICLK